MLVKESTVDGIVFGTSRRSREEQDVDQQPRAAGTLYWRETLQQVRRAGAVRPLPDRTSDAVFAACPREAQATAWSSHQSQPLRDEASLRRRTAALVDGDDPLGRPVDWGAHVLVFDEIEFWTGRLDRLHRRLAYWAVDGRWRARRLQP